MEHGMTEYKWLEETNIMRASVRRANTKTTHYEQHARHVEQHFSIRINTMSGTGSADSVYARPETEDRWIEGFPKAIALMYINAYPLFPRWKT